MTVVVALQATATIFFIVDVAGDLSTEGFGGHLLIEGVAAIALLAAVIMGAFQVRWLVLGARQDEISVALVKGAATELIQLRFTQWKLTGAEADVACSRSRDAMSKRYQFSDEPQLALSAPSSPKCMRKRESVHSPR